MPDAGTTKQPSTAKPPESNYKGSVSVVACGPEPELITDDGFSKDWQKRALVVASESNGIRYVLITGKIDFAASVKDGLDAQSLSIAVNAANDAFSGTYVYDQKTYVVISSLYVGDSVVKHSLGNTSLLPMATVRVGELSGGALGRWFVDSQRVTISDWKLMIADFPHVLAHEIAHGFGLMHLPNSTGGLSSYCGDKLIPQEAAAIWQRFAH